jgi:RNA polymerase sigma-70 factor (ECF subfamily)
MSRFPPGVRGEATPRTASIADAWAEHRPYLVNLAFRMLGDIGDSEDVVQEAYARLITAGPAGIEDARGWLIVVTSRLCLDQLRSARRRLTDPRDLAADESRLEGLGSAFVDPADRITLDDRVRLALDVVLSRLTPPERVVFVLHDVFAVPFDGVAEAVGRSPAACRQLASRARAKIDPAPPVRRPTDGPENRRIADSFIAACAGADLAGLVAVLDPAVSGWVDLNRARVFTGRDRIAPNLLRFWGPPAELVAVHTGELPLLLAFRDRRLRAVIELVVAQERIAEVHVHISERVLSGARARLLR